MLVFEERGKLEYPEKNLLEQSREQQQTQPTYDVGFGNQTRDTLVGGEHSHHCANPAPLMIFLFAAGLDFLDWCGFGLEYSLQVNKTYKSVKLTSRQSCMSVHN